MSDWEKRFEEKPLRTTFKFGSGLAVALIGISLVAGAVALVVTPFWTASGIVQRTANPDNVIQNYEWFKRQVQDVAAIDSRLQASRRALDVYLASAGDRSKWTFEDKQEFSRLNSIILGLEGQRASMVAEYNARSQMANRALFKTSDLPETLN
jgi:hypothetical protein